MHRPAEEAVIHSPLHHGSTITAAYARAKYPKTQQHGKRTGEVMALTVL
jgi:hypothetical protein